jgi:hypothetical protein
MTYRGIFLADGPSDLPLSEHLQQLCADLGADVTLTAIDPALLGRTARRVDARLAFLLKQQAAFDIAFVHRDAEGESAARRREEVSSGAAAAGVACPVVPVVPVRMTEAWLLLDEAAIRRVAARPTGRVPLDLPSLREVETIANPKQRLADALLAASETTGRRRQNFRRDFGRHRSLLLRQLDSTGQLTQLTAWQQLRADAEVAIRDLSSA